YLPHRFRFENHLIDRLSQTTTHGGTPLVLLPEEDGARIEALISRSRRRPTTRQRSFADHTLSQNRKRGSQTREVFAHRRGSEAERSAAPLRQPSPSHAGMGRCLDSTGSPSLPSPWQDNCRTTLPVVF